MANHAQLALFARKVMLLGVETAALSTLAEELRLTGYANELFDIELELARLHRKILELSPQDLSTPPPDEPTGWVDDSVPF